MKRFFLILSMAVGAMLPTNAYAQQDISVSAEVNTNRVELGSFAELTLKIQGTQSVSAPQLPKIEGFQTRYVGPSTNITIINGQQSSAISFVYYLYP